VHACRQDTRALTIDDEQDLEKYAFGVAGNVGLIMYPILGGTLPAGREYATQLGMAMQGTNIARDIVEDLERGRVYIPSTWLDRGDLLQLLANDGRYEQSVVQAVGKLLRWAGERYSRGLSGLHYLAPENRFAIQVAARCYAAIGDRVIVQGRLARRRATVSLGKKIALACQTRLCKERVPEYHR
jgi:phytoene synthase